jgi:protein-L-isoaspartate(D-aspartate) O-methyltransferase
MVKRLKLQGIDDNVVLKAMMNINRHFFVDSALSSRAYEDTALPIGYKQTISQPYVVARVTSLIRILAGFSNHAGPNQGRVLEVGTGCGYQAAVMSKCFNEVYSIERISELYEQSKKRLSLIDVSVNLRFGDGLRGWPEKSPFDAIIFSGGLETIPTELLSQIRINGVMIMPFGKVTQNLIALVKTGKKNSDVTKHVFDFVKYVPILDGVEK